MGLVSKFKRKALKVTRTNEYPNYPTTVKNRN